MTTPGCIRSGVATKRTATAIADVADGALRTETVTVATPVRPTTLQTGYLLALDSGRGVYIWTPDQHSLKKTDAAGTTTTIVDISSATGSAAGMKTFHDAETGVGITGLHVLANGGWVLFLGCYQAYSAGHTRGQMWLSTDAGATWALVHSNEDGVYMTDWGYSVNNVLYTGDYNTLSAGFHCGYNVYRVDFNESPAVVDIIHVRSTIEDPDATKRHFHLAVIDPTNSSRLYCAYGDSATALLISLTKPGGWATGDSPAGASPWTYASVPYPYCTISGFGARTSTIDVWCEDNGCYNFNPATGDWAEILQYNHFNYPSLADAVKTAAAHEAYYLGDGTALVPFATYTNNEAGHPCGIYATADGGTTWAAVFRDDTGAGDVGRGVRRIIGPWQGGLLLDSVSGDGDPMVQSIPIPDVALVSAVRVSKGWTNLLADKVNAGYDTVPSTFTKTDGTTPHIGYSGFTWYKSYTGTVTAVTGGEHGLHAMQLAHPAPPGNTYDALAAVSRSLETYFGSNPLAANDKITVRFRAKAISPWPQNYRLNASLTVAGGDPAAVTNQSRVFRLGTTWRDYAFYYAGGATPVLSNIVLDIDNVTDLTDVAFTVLVDAVEVIASQTDYFPPGDFQPGSTARGNEYATVPLAQACNAWAAAFAWKPGTRSGNHSANMAVASVVNADASAYVNLTWTAATGKFTVTDADAHTASTVAAYAFRDFDLLRFVLTSDGTDTWLHIFHPVSGLETLKCTGVKAAAITTLRLGTNGAANAFCFGQFAGVRTWPSAMSAGDITTELAAPATATFAFGAQAWAVADNLTLEGDCDLGTSALTATATGKTIDGTGATSIAAGGCDIFANGKTLTVDDMGATTGIRCWGGCTLTGTNTNVQNLPGPPDEY